MRIRPATDADRDAILGVHSSAFGVEQGPGIVGLVDELLADATAVPLCSLVAEAGGRIVGHVLFSAVRLPAGRQSVRARILAPLAVAREHQGEGIGSALVREGLERLRASRIELVFVLGEPGFYRRFGFRPAGPLGLEAPHPVPEAHEEAWMVRALRAGLLGRARGRVQCADALDRPRHWRE